MIYFNIKEGSIIYVIFPQKKTYLILNTMNKSYLIY